MKTIQYVNFVPPEWTEAFARKEIGDIIDKAPSDSYVAALAEQQSENRFRAVLEISASDVRFFVEAIGANSFECIQKTCDQAREKLAEWREHRFNNQVMAS